MYFIIKWIDFMSKISIKLHIANRIYPMKIEDKSEEYIRNAVKKIQHRLKFFEENYATKDKQDILAMCLIEYASKFESINQNKLLDEDDINKQLIQIDNLLSKNT